MRTTIAVVLLTLPALAQAQSTCRGYEFSELKEMRKGSLETTYCQYEVRGNAWREMAILEAKYGRTAAMERASRSAEVCGEEMERIAKVLRAQHKASPPICR